MIHAWNGLEAVNIFRDNKDIEVILMDISMPELDGMTATRRIREIEAGNLEKSRIRIPIIALTASVMKEERKACITAGMDAVIGKPIDFDELFETLERIVPEGKGSGNEIEKRKTITVPRSFPEIDGVDASKGSAPIPVISACSQSIVSLSRIINITELKIKPLPT